MNMFRLVPYSALENHQNEGLYADTDVTQASNGRKPDLELLVTRYPAV